MIGTYSAQDSCVYYHNPELNYKTVVLQFQKGKRAYTLATLASDIFTNVGWEFTCNPEQDTQEAKGIRLAGMLLSMTIFKFVTDRSYKYLSDALDLSQYQRLGLMCPEIDEVSELIKAYKCRD